MYKEQNTEGQKIHRKYKFLGFRFQHDTIGVNYMDRWIFETPFGMIRVHKIMRSDEGRHFHDHPFDFISFILTGGYVERRPDHPAQEYGPGSVVVRKAEDLHSLRLLGKTAWTLVFASQYKRVWGFSTEEGWVLAENYDEWRRVRTNGKSKRHLYEVRKDE